MHPTFITDYVFPSQNGKLQDSKFRIRLEASPPQWHLDMDLHNGRKTVRLMLTWDVIPDSDFSHRADSDAQGSYRILQLWDQLFNAALAY